MAGRWRLRLSASMTIPEIMPNKQFQPDRIASVRVRRIDCKRALVAFAEEYVLPHQGLVLLLAVLSGKFYGITDNQAAARAFSSPVQTHTQAQ